jgi:hypothetical protein
VIVLWQSTSCSRPPARNEKEKGGKMPKIRKEREGKNDKNDFWIVKLNLKKLN